jgi:hypothetical protein
MEHSMNEETPRIGAPWVLIRSGKGTRPTALNVLNVDTKSRGERVGILIYVFLNKDMATDFVAALATIGQELAEFVPYQLRDPAELKSLLIDLKNTGITHVYFNPTSPFGDDPNQQPVPIERVFDNCTGVGE